MSTFDVALPQVADAQQQPIERADSTRTPLSMLGGEEGTAGDHSNVDIALSWKDISFGAGDRNILHNLTGTALPCRLLVIMGKSGAGKTTLLKLLADRLDTGGDRRATGDILVNNVPLQYKDRGLLAFVPQDDILDGHATAEEVLSFSLRVRRGTSVERTNRHVERTLEELGLAHVRETVIGVPGLTTGLSGGERKRANIGVELITQPKIMLLDEPTTGLDSVTAARVSHMLQTLARNGRTILCTLHQPTAEMLQYFDDLLLLSAGRTVYHGPMSDAVAYFTSIGYECPEDYTPTDYFMGLIQDDAICPVLIEAWAKHIEGWVANGNAHGSVLVPAQVTVTPDETQRYLDATTASIASPFSVQLWELLKRSWRANMRNQANIIAQLVQALVFSTFVSILFHNLTKDVTGLSDRMGIFFILTVDMGFSTLAAMINSFPPIKAVYIRDQQSDSYSPVAFFLAKSVADLPLQLLSVLIRMIMIYFSTRLHVAATNFWTFFAVLFFLQQVCVGVGWVLSAASPNVMISSAILPVIMTPMLLSGGLLASTERLEPYWVWLNRISFVRQGLLVMSHQEFGSLGHISCNPAKFDCTAQPKNGQEAMVAYGLTGSADQDWVAWTCLAVEFVLLRLLAILALYRAGRAKE